MKLWSLGLDNNNLDNFPQVLYKNKPITIEQEMKLTHEIFKIFYLTHRDKKNQIRVIENYKNELPFKDLYNLVFPDKNVEFHTEYLVDLLNLFCIELENLSKS